MQSLWVAGSTAMLQREQRNMAKVEARADEERCLGPGTLAGSVVGSTWGSPHQASALEPLVP